MANPKSKERHVPDYVHWSFFAAWTFQDAAALSLGIDPEIVKSPDCTEAQRTQYTKRLAIIDSHRLMAGHFPKSGNVEPQLFIAWAKQFGINIPDALADTVAAQHGKGDNWDLTNKYASEVDALKEEIYAVKAQCQILISQLERIKPIKPRHATTRGLVPKEQQSLLKLVLGMAMEQYDYQPAAGNSKAPGQISSDLENCGISIDAETVLRWLRIAAGQVEFETK